MSENVKNGQSTKDLVESIMQVKDNGPMETLWLTFERAEHRGVILSDQFRKMLRKAFFAGAWTGFSFMDKILAMPEDQAVPLIRNVQQELESNMGKKPTLDPLFGVDNLKK